MHLKVILNYRHIQDYKYQISRLNLGYFYCEQQKLFLGLRFFSCIYFN